MSKRFAEHNGLNLTQTNNDVLQMWKEKNAMVTPESITCWRAASRTPSTAIRP